MCVLGGAGQAVCTTQPSCVRPRLCPATAVAVASRVWPVLWTQRGAVCAEVSVCSQVCWVQCLLCVVVAVVVAVVVHRSGLARSYNSSSSRGGNCGEQRSLLRWRGGEKCWLLRMKQGEERKE